MNEYYTKISLCNDYGYCYNGMREGLGLYTGENGDSYSGEWHLDKKHGYGEYIYGETWERYRGEGTYYWTPRKKVVGTWKNSMILGEATYYYDDGTIFKGILTDGHVQLCNNKKIPVEP